MNRFNAQLYLEGTTARKAALGMSEDNWSFEPREYPRGWLTVLNHGIAVRHMPPDLPLRYIADPEYRAEIGANETKHHDRARK
jgi:hypothetical protein